MNRFQIQLFFSNLYWIWRLSRLSRPYYAIKTFVFIQWNARKIANQLDEVRIVLGREMKHPLSITTNCKKCDHKLVLDNPNKDCMVMKTEDRSKLIYNICWQTLPNGWEWRKDK
jgi:hypothetical protein